MDNILKLIVGCLGLVGLIVMLVPNSDPLASGNTDAEGPPPVASAGPDSAAPPPPPPPPPAPEPQQQSDTGEFVVDDYDISSFGQPMVDPTPPGQRQQLQNQQQQGIANAGQPQLVGTDSAGPAGPPPPPPITAN